MNLWTLVGTVEHACNLACLESLVRWCRPCPRLWVLDDGTLSAAQARDYKAAGFELVGAQGHPLPFIESALSRFPELQSARQKQAAVRKIVDVPLCAAHFTPDARVHYIDSDILFLRPFHFFELDHPLPLFAESRDVSVSFWDLLSQKRPVHAFLNSGMFSIPLPDLGRVETWFQSFHNTWKVHGRGTAPWLWEQSTFSYLHAEAPARFVPDSAVLVPRLGEQPLRLLQHRCAQGRAPFAVHLVRGFKDQFANFSGLALEQTDVQALPTCIRNPSPPLLALRQKVTAVVGARVRRALRGAG